MNAVVTTLLASWILHLGITQLRSSTDSLALINLFQRLQRRAYGGTGSREGIEKLRKLGKVQETLSSDVPFPCPLNGTRSRTRPTSVHKLRPGDIDVIAALGDSYISGHQMASIRVSPSALGNRGLSWAIGGYGEWREFLTLPNILKVFNPKLIGYSYGDSFTNEKDSQFNVAEPGAQAKDMEYMAKVLIKRIRADSRVDFKNDWKLVILMIGGNDICSDLCYLPIKAMEKSPETYRQHLMSTMEYLRDNLPRTLVSIVSATNLELAVRRHNPRHIPRACIDTLRIECSCIFRWTRISRRRRILQIQNDWYRIEREVADGIKFKTKEDFAVVHQPFIQESSPVRHENGTIDLRHLTVDCLHLSQRGNAMMANNIWNNLLEPVGKKTKSWTKIWTKFLCTNEEHPYIYTWKNSNVSCTKE